MRCGLSSDAQGLNAQAGARLRVERDMSRDVARVAQVSSARVDSAHEPERPRAWFGAP